MEAWKAEFDKRNWSIQKAENIAERFYSVGGTTIDRIIERSQAECGGEEPDEDVRW